MQLSLITSMAVIVTTWRNDQPWLRPLLCAYFLTIVCIFTCFVTVRLSAVGFKRIRRLSFARLLLLFVLVDSYLFGFCTTLMLFGVNPASSPRSCSATMWICVWVYGFTKIGMFTFLVERLRAVTSHTTALLDDRFLQRLKNPWYSIGLSILVFWVAGAGVLIAVRQGLSRVRQGVEGKLRQSPHHIRATPAFCAMTANAYLGKLLSHQYPECS